MAPAAIFDFQIGGNGYVHLLWVQRCIAVVNSGSYECSAVPEKSLTVSIPDHFKCLLTYLIQKY